MRPVRLVVPGSYWDSLIYAGRLYLFDLTGAVLTLDWDRLIDAWPIPEDLRLTLACAYRRSDYLYGNRWDLLFGDQGVRELITSKFLRLASMYLEVDRNLLEVYTLGIQDCPFPFPFSDATVYGKTIYSSSSRGVFSATCNKRTELPISTRSRHLSDISSYSIAASYMTLVMAGGDDGLFEIPLQHWLERSNERAVDNGSCDKCSWMFQSIYASSRREPGRLLDYQKVSSGRMNGSFFDSDAVEQPERSLRGIVQDTEMFRFTGFSFGQHDKICKMNGRAFEVARYRPWSKADEPRIVGLGVVDIPTESHERELSVDNAGIIDGAVSHFGVIIEHGKRLTVFSSDGEIATIAGDIVNWRVFPRSKHYENQLHIAFEDRLEIWSFNGDYFVDQEQKVLGAQHFGR